LQNTVHWFTVRKDTGMLMHVDYCSEWAAVILPAMCWVLTSLT